MSDEPLYQHDCKACRFLGSLTKDDKAMDLYFCGEEPGSTVIARYSDEGPDYSSGLGFAEMFGAVGRHDEPLYIALKRAIDAGLIALKTYYVGCSMRKDEEVEDAFFSDEYHKHKPDIEDYDNLNEDNSGYTEYDRAVEAFDKTWKESGKTMPRLHMEAWHFFDNEEQMRNYCEADYCMVIEAVSENHINEVVRNNGMPWRYREYLMKSQSGK